VFQDGHSCNVSWVYLTCY